MKKVLMFSGGIKSSALLMYFVRAKQEVVPVYIKDGLNVEPIMEYFRGRGVGIVVLESGDITIVNDSVSLWLFTYVGAILKANEIVVGFCADDLGVDPGLWIHQHYLRSYLQRRYGLKLSLPFVKYGLDRVVALAAAYHTPLALTVTCTCGTCYKCISRKEAFLKNGIKP
jgi:7-cyano-7-deazaguanine synthase in queuosine biosynthesis